MKIIIEVELLDGKVQEVTIRRPDISSDRIIVGEEEWSGRQRSWTVYESPGLVDLSLVENTFYIDTRKE